MLHLICGTSGAGKSRLLLDKIREDIQNQRRCYLLIPEQQAYISERDLLDALPSEAGLYFHITNFSKLADEIFRQYGGVTQLQAGNGIRSVMMWETLRQVYPMLVQYGKSRLDATITAEMLATLEEFNHNGIDADQLEEVVSKLEDGSPLRKKLTDLSLILSVYNQNTSERCGGTLSDRIAEATEMLKKHAFFEKCNVYVDSFSSFTAPEYVFLKQLLGQANSLTVALCTDQISSDLPHFEGITRTARQLERISKDVGVTVSVTNLCNHSKDKPTELRLLESGLWNFRLTKATRPLPSEQDTVAVHLQTAANKYEECEACAIEILGLVQSGIKYGEIAVVMRESDTYRGILDAALERHGIPYFLSERTDLSSKPLSRLILSALRAVSQNYQAQDILTLLKTGISGANLRDVALFEEYCETWHITGKRFTDEVWSMNPDGLTDKRSERGDEILLAANKVRKIVMEPLERLKTDLRASKKMPDLCRALYEYLCRLDIQQQLSNQAKKELLLGERREAGETLRLYRFITEALIQLAELLPDSELTAEEFLSILTIFFSVTDLGSVPNVRDCVVIGSANTLRVEHVKASFLLGLCEGEFPKAVSDTGLLTESDKIALEEFGIEFDSRQKLRSSEELFYVYRAVTKPSETLFLSYPAMQTDGSQQTPSMAISRAEFLLNRSAKTVKASAFARNNIENTEKSTKNHSLPPLGSNVRLHLSQSSIQTFALCPYRYYASHRLKLRGQKDSSIGAADEGNFLHFVFERFLKKCLSENQTLSLPSLDELPALADEVIEEYLECVCPIPPEEMDHRLLHLLRRLRGLAVLILREIVGELSSGSFTPVGFEQRLGGSEKNSLPAVLLNLTDGCTVELHGTVDRVDVFEKDEKLYVRIVDYKTGEHKFSFDKVRTGEDLQLVLYLFAVVSSNPDRYVPCGAEFLYSSKENGRTTVSRSGFLLEEESIRHAADCSEAQGYLKGLSSTSLDQITLLTEEMKDVICEIAERILSGEAEKTPSPDACRFCDLKKHCDVACHEKK